MATTTTQNEINLHAQAAVFAQKEQAILAAIARAEGLKLKYFPMLDNWPFAWDINLIHDLIWRLEQRFWDNFSDYHEWHWDTYQCNAYQ